jgi:hypothetical protein
MGAGFLPDCQREFPWRSDRGIYLWGYGVGHSHLLFRDDLHDGPAGSGAVHILFSGVRSMEISTFYRGPVELSAAPQRELSSKSLRWTLWPVEISGSDGRGLVVASGIRISQVAPGGEELELLSPGSSSGSRTGRPWSGDDRGAEQSRPPSEPR